MNTVQLLVLVDCPDQDFKTEIGNHIKPPGIRSMKRRLSRPATTTQSTAEERIITDGDEDSICKKNSIVEDLRA